jgi:copper homeostasis protein
VDGPAGLDAAVKGGADRIELCSALSVAGLTPSAGFMRRAAEVDPPSYAMIRPRPGDFRFTRGEVDLMRADIDAVHDAGLAGVVLGASRADGSLDARALERLVAHAASLGLGATLHRAFDLAPDLSAALETAIGLGFERVLTSGGAPSAPEALERLRALVAQAGERISIMPGAGVTAGNVRRLVDTTGVHEVHGSFSRRRRPRGAPQRLTALGFGQAERAETDEAAVAAARAALKPCNGRA